jgi:transcriptional regulator with XRE-family HTH domain
MTGQELRVALAALGLSQRFLASELGVHTVTVSRWCGDALPVPKYVSAYLGKCLAERSGARWHG